ncbi:MAG: hypothetical protein ISS25_00870 [Nanoarchaeota archaeon]|nr:hypothetical protein [DPANN group archaeon]MBL7116368.1 hypothetical protein [Nanoarchaeota archaeon]
MRTLTINEQLRMERKQKRIQKIRGRVMLGLTATVILALGIVMFPNKYERADTINHVVKQGESEWAYFRSEESEGGDFGLYQRELFLVNNHTYDWNGEGLKLKVGDTVELLDVNRDNKVGSKQHNNYHGALN